MSYFLSITVPPNTPKTDPLIYDLVITPLVIDKVSIVFPTGCVYLCGIRFTYRAFQIFPYNDNSWYIGNGNDITFFTEFSCDNPPFVLQIELYNEDEIYPHTPTILIDVTFINNRDELRKEILNGYMLPRVVKGRNRIN